MHGKQRGVCGNMHGTCCLATCAVSVADMCAASNKNTWQQVGRWRHSRQTQKTRERQLKQIAGKTVNAKHTKKKRKENNQK